MEAFLSRKRRRLSPVVGESTARPASPCGEEDSTDMKLTILSSLYPDRLQDDLLEILLGCDGSVDTAIETISSSTKTLLYGRQRRATRIGLQSSLPFSGPRDTGMKLSKTLTKRGKTLHLFSPADIAAHTPCSIIHNFLPTELANSLLNELLPEVTTYSRATFKLFDNVVQSPHSACFYVDNLEERDRQKSEYLYSGSYLDDVREMLPVMQKVQAIVQEAVNREIQIRIREHYPDGKKLKYQSPGEWQPNAAFVNCYDGGAQSVGYHSDRLSYLGPRAVIGSLSLGVAREFR